MQVFLTNLNTPVRCKNPNGTINLHYLEIWPFWSYPKFTTLFSYERASQKYIVSVIMGKTYTFEDLRSLIDKHLNSNDEQVALLYHNNGRVSWRVFPNTETSDISLSPGLLDILKLRDAKIHNGIITGQPINKASITFTFSDANMIFLTCDQIDDTYVNKKSTQTLAIIYVSSASNGTLKTNLSPSSFHFSENYDRKLNFHLHDQNGNEVPVKQFFARLTIND